MNEESAAAGGADQAVKLVNSAFPLEREKMKASYYLEPLQLLLICFPFLILLLNLLISSILAYQLIKHKKQTHFRPDCKQKTIKQ